MNIRTFFSTRMKMKMKILTMKMMKTLRAPHNPENARGRLLTKRWVISQMEMTFG